MVQKRKNEKTKKQQTARYHLPLRLAATFANASASALNSFSEIVKKNITLRQKHRQYFKEKNMPLIREGLKTNHSDGGYQEK